MALRFHLGLFTFNPFGVGAYMIPKPQVPPGAIHIQPLWGWSLSRPSPRFHLGLFTFNPFGVGAYMIPKPQVPPVALNIQPLWGWSIYDTKTPGSTWGYSHSTPLGLGPFPAIPQVPPGAIHYSHSTPLGLEHI